MPAKRSLIIPVALVLVAAVAATSQCASHSLRAQPQSPSSTPSPISLSLPTTIHFGDSTSGGAYLAKPTSRARVTLGQALLMNDLGLPASRTAAVLADVTMPTDLYEGKAIRHLTCWAIVYILPQAENVSQGPPGTAPIMVQHSVTILDARTGAFVRGFYTK